jgi:uncharacterized membrane-anchored protein
MKKLILYALIAYMAVLFIVPGFLVFRHYNTLMTGEEFKFIVAPFDPYDPFHGRYVQLQPRWGVQPYYAGYAFIHRDEQGFAYVSNWSGKKPRSGDYAKRLDLSRYYMNEKMAPEAERLQRNRLEDDLFYLKVMIKNGNYVIEGLYINDIRIEEYILSR